MNGPERKRPQFTEEEKEKVREKAIELASKGEDAVWEYTLIKKKLFSSAIANLQRSPGQPGSLEAVRTVMHQVETMSETVEYARKILRLHGKDTTSEIERLKEKISQNQ
jgi:hypothetical protein